MAELGMDDIRAVARSLGLQHPDPAPHVRLRGPGESRVTLSITLVDVTTMRPRWTVACSETLYEPSETMNRLAKPRSRTPHAARRPHSR